MAAVRDAGYRVVNVDCTVIAQYGAALAYVLDRYRVITIPSDIYQVSYLPFKLLPGDFAAVVIGAVFAALDPVNLWLTEVLEG